MLKHIFFWSDILEIVALSSALYYALEKLVHSNHAHMPKLILSCLGVLTTSYVLQLHILFSLALYALPLFVFSAFVFPYATTTTPSPSSFRASKKPSVPDCNQWIDELVKGTINAFNAQIPLTILIVDAQSVEHLIINTIMALPLSAQTLELIYTNSLFKSSDAIVISPSGILIGFNVSIEQLKSSIHHTQISYAAFAKEHNACFLYAEPKRRTFSALLRGSHYEKLPSHTLISLLKTHYSRANVLLKESHYEESTGTIQEKNHS